MPYAELHCKTNFSFLQGASHPEELVQRAAELGYAALAITDVHSLAGVVRAHGAARETGLKLIIGAEIALTDAPPVVLWATDRAAYARLSRLITCGRRRAAKGDCVLSWDDLAAHAQGLLAGVRVAEAAAAGSGGDK
jgi:error-prone DNA polymerase